MNGNDILSKLMLTNPEAGVLEAFDKVLQSGCLGPLRRTDAGETGICPVVDTNGNPLTANGLYSIKGDPRFLNVTHIKVRSWAFGSGNMLDRYYRVWYTDSNLEDSFIVINATYPNGVFDGAIYQSKFTPLN